MCVCVCVCVCVCEGPAITLLETCTMQLVHSRKKSGNLTDCEFPGTGKAQESNMEKRVQDSRIGVIVSQRTTKLFACVLIL